MSRVVRVLLHLYIINAVYLHDCFMKCYHVMWWELLLFCSVSKVICSFVRRLSYWWLMILVPWWPLPKHSHPLFKDASSQIPRPEFITVSSYNKCRMELKQCIPTLVNYASHCYIGYTGVLIRGLCLLLEAVGMMLMLLSLDHHYQHTGARYDLWMMLSLGHHYHHIGARVV